MSEMEISEVRVENAFAETIGGASNFQINEIKVEFYHSEETASNSSNINNNFKKKRGRRGRPCSAATQGYKAAVKLNSETSSGDREPTKELLDTWREALQTTRQICCPFPECQLSYCSIRGLMLHYRQCTGVRTGSEIVKCKICCHYVSGRISLAHHNRLLHSGKPAKSVDTFMESKSYPLFFHASSLASNVRTTKSMRRVRKPARYRETQDSKDPGDGSGNDDFTQNLSPVSANKSKTMQPSATITRLASGSYKKEDFPEAVQKSSFLYHIGLAPTDIESKVVVLEEEEEEAEDKLPVAEKGLLSNQQNKTSDDVKPSQVVEPLSSAQTNIVNAQTVAANPPVKRKRGRPRKIRPEEMTPVNSSNNVPVKDNTDNISPVRKRMRRHGPAEGTKPNKPVKSSTPMKNEFLTITVCGECWEEFRDPKLFDQHVLAKHNGTQTPLMPDNQKLLMKEQKAQLQKTMRQYGILTCPNQHCKKPLLSMTGYQNHIKNCKPVEEEIICNQCNTTFSTSESFKGHATAKHNGLAKPMSDNRPFTLVEKESILKGVLELNRQLICTQQYCGALFSSVSEYLKHSDVCIKKDPPGIVCGICKNEFPNKGNFEYHARQTHNGLARPDGESQIFTNSEELQVLKKTIRISKRLRCLRENCAKTFGTIPGYQYHIKQCGQEVKVVECETCGKKLKESSIRTHMKMSHPPTPPSKSTKTEQGDLSQPRSAAKRAREKVLEITKNLGGQDEGCELSSDEIDDDYVNSDMGSDIDSEGQSIQYTKPTESISSQIFAEWKKTFELNGSVTCPHEPCEKQFTTVEKLQKHYKLCPKSTMSLSFTCSKCGKKTCTQGQMENHIRCHNRKEKRSLVSQQGEETDDGSVEDVLSACGKIRLSSSHSVKFEPLRCAADWTKEFLEQNYDDSLFGQWRPVASNWTLMSPIDYDLHLPEEIESISFKYTDALKKDASATDWTKLQRLTSSTVTIDAQISPSTLFAGGPVWAMAWCPTPRHKLADQYLAISCHKAMEEKFPLAPVLSKAGLIQIWKVGAQSQTSSNLESSFALGISHNFGAVWQLEWCPSGCWDETGKKTQDGSILPSLGLLAAACSDGKIYIFSIPVPSSLPKSSSLPIFATTPAVILQTEPVLSVGNANTGLNCQCVSMSWLRYKGHSKIAGGFTNGCVAFWDIKADSVLLRKQSSKGEVFSPYQTFQAHSRCVQDVSWAPFTDGVFLATVGADRQLLFWSTEDLSIPCNAFKQGHLLRLAWPPYWCGAASTQDECFNKGSTIMKFRNGYDSYNSCCLLAHNGCMWDLSHNDWLNCVVSCDANGEVIGSVLPQLLGNIRHLKTLNHHRFPIYRTDLLALNPSPTKDISTASTSERQINDKDVATRKSLENSESGVDVRQNENEVTKKINGGNPETIEDKNLTRNLDDPNNAVSNLNDTTAVDVTAVANEMELSFGKRKPDTYKDAAENFGLVYSDLVPNSGSAFPKQELQRLKNFTTMTPTDLQTFPVTSVNRIAWNPNLGSHLLLATGGQSGLVRFHRIRWLHQTNTDKMHAEILRETSTSSVVNEVRSSEKISTTILAPGVPEQIPSADGAHLNPPIATLPEQISCTVASQTILPSTITDQLATTAEPLSSADLASFTCASQPASSGKNNNQFECLREKVRTALQSASKSHGAETIDTTRKNLNPDPGAITLTCLSPTCHRTSETLVVSHQLVGNDTPNS